MYHRKALICLSTVLWLAAISAPAAELPRKAPELTINLNSGKQVLLSQYRGKVVAVLFMLTTCPHCQKTVGFLSRLQEEYGPRGFQVLATAIQENAALAVPGFVGAFHPTFPVGYNTAATAVEFMQHPPMLIPMMPMLAFVDRQGMIQVQHKGDDEQFFGDHQEQNLRAVIEGLLKESAAPARKAPAKKASSTKKGS